MTKARDLADNALNNKPKIIDAKGDLIVGTAADSASVLAIGSNGQSLVADSGTATGLRWQDSFVAGCNKILNSDFSIWQRGTSFTPGGSAYTADRWISGRDGSGTFTVTQQTFTPGAAPVAGYEGATFWQGALSTVSATTYYELTQRIEDVRTFAGQTVTISFWARLSTGTLSSPYVRLNQVFGSGGSAQVTGSGNAFTPTGSWARYTATVTLPSISGKTIGTSSFLEIQFIFVTGGATSTSQIWGVQVEAGSVATPFNTATGNLASELAACQRYYQILNATEGRINLIGTFVDTTNVRTFWYFITKMRGTPILSFVGTWRFIPGGGSATLSSLGEITPYCAGINVTGATSTTLYSIIVQSSDTLDARLIASAEL